MGKRNEQILFFKRTGTWLEAYTNTISEMQIQTLLKDHTQQ